MERWKELMRKNPNKVASIFISVEKEGWREGAYEWVTLQTQLTTAHLTYQCQAQKRKKFHRWRQWYRYSASIAKSRIESDPESAHPPVPAAAEHSRSLSHASTARQGSQLDRHPSSHTHWWCAAQHRNVHTVQTDWQERDLAVSGLQRREKQREISSLRCLISAFYLQEQAPLTEGV